DTKRSSMFVGSLVAAIAATLALLLLATVQIFAPPPPPPQQPPQGVRPPPPPIFNQQTLLSVIIIAAALFTIAWIATIASAIRAQILRETHKVMADYGEAREVGGYDVGYRQGSRPAAEVRQLHPVPPID